MNRFAVKPAGGIIQEREDIDGPVLFWSAPSSLAGRLVGALFLGGWLLGWAFGEYAVGCQLLGGNFHLFLVGWLVAWTAGGCFAIFAFWSLIRPSRPESVHLGDHEFVYDPGWRVLSQTEMSQSASEGRNPLLPRRRVVATRAEIGKFVIDRVGERQRLTFDHGAHRVEIGACLGEPEREWLLGVLERWRQRGRF